MSLWLSHQESLLQRLELPLSLGAAAPVPHRLPACGLPAVGSVPCALKQGSVDSLPVQCATREAGKGQGNRWQEDQIWLWGSNCLHGQCKHDGWGMALWKLLAVGTGEKEIQWAQGWMVRGRSQPEPQEGLEQPHL